MNNGMVCSFVGHRRLIITKCLENNLNGVLEYLVNSGVHSFLVGTNGEFDELALKMCLNLKLKYNFIKLTLVYNSITRLNNKMEDEFYKSNGVDRVSYCVEDVHFKRRITESNKMMILNSDIIVAYVDKNQFQSGAKKSLLFAEKQNKKIINLFN